MQLELDRGHGRDAGGRADLFDVFRARRAEREVRLHALVFLAAERPVEEGRDQLDDLPAGDPTGDDRELRHGVDASK